MTQSITSLTTNQSRSIVGEIELASSGVKIINSTDVDIRKSLGYGIVLLGVPKNKVPQSEEEKIVILSFIKKTFPNITRFDINLAFDYAVEGKFKTELSLYGGTFSAGFVGGIIRGYLDYKNNIISQNKKKEGGMNNNQIAGAVVSLLGKEGIETITRKERTREEQRNELKKEISKIPLPHEEEIQDWFKEFDAIEKSKTNEAPERMVSIDGKIYDINEFINYKLKQNIK